MGINIFRKTRKYVSYYFLLVKYAAQIDLIYWGNFITSIFVELFYQGAFIAFFAIIMTKTSTIAGWGPYQMAILLGIDTFCSELITGMIIVWGARELPNAIWSGELDRTLVKPINPLFILTLGRPYFPSFISIIPGFLLIWYGLSNLHIGVSVIGLLSSAAFFIAGFALAYFVIVDFSLLSFFFQDTTTLPRIGERVVYGFTSRPHPIYNNVLRVVFYFILPVVYVSSFSTYSLLNGPPVIWLLIAFVLVLLFGLLTNLLWKKAIGSYSSASS